MGNLFETVTGLFSYGDMLAQPEHLVTQLTALSIVWAVVFLIVGVLCMFNGYKFYRATTICLAGMLGLFGGYGLGTLIDAPYVVAGCLAVLLAVIALPLLKYAVAVFGGLAGAFLGANLWAGMTNAVNQASGSTTVPTDTYWVGALLGLIVCGMLAFVLFKLSIVLFTSVSGATFAVLGAIALLLSFEPWRASVSEGLTASRMVVPLLVFVPALIGLILQEAWAPGEQGDS